MLLSTLFGQWLSEFKFLRYDLINPFSGILRAPFYILPFICAIIKTKLEQIQPG